MRSSLVPQTSCPLLCFVICLTLSRFSNYPLIWDHYRIFKVYWLGLSEMVTIGNDWFKWVYMCRWAKAASSNGSAHRESGSLMSRCVMWLDMKFRITDSCSPDNCSPDSCSPFNSSPITLNCNLWPLLCFLCVNIIITSWKQSNILPLHMNLLLLNFSIATVCFRLTVWWAFVFSALVN